MVVKIDHVQKKINQRTIINDMSLYIKQGKTFLLLGPNGSGKTTTIRLLTGLLKPTKGNISLFEQPITESNSNELRKRIGVQNDGNLYERLTVEENLIIWGKLYGMHEKQCQLRLKELLVLFDLTERKSSKVGNLSKGMRQKVAIARSLFHQPELLILDEPTSGLDPEVAENLIQYLANLMRKTNMTIIMSTHQLQGLEKLADDIAIIKNGELN